ncbi:hypothetical protein DPX16_20049 [Anabarilius grahami]|uniref:Uncharacterized protein n=1 Tax=Anabarilius grahami TaxID=495550 RepID=A0A3N0XQM1_ANAGA|nr:hypothetical protein DPX16_20049 [Anabarilius grahami]
MCTTVPHSDLVPEPIQPPATRAKAWQAIPGVSTWVLKIIKRGHVLQFTQRAPFINGVAQTSVENKDVHVLHSEDDQESNRFCPVRAPRAYINLFARLNSFSSASVAARKAFRSRSPDFPDGLLMP